MRRRIEFRDVNSNDVAAVVEDLNDGSDHPFRININGQGSHFSKRKMERLRSFITARLIVGGKKK